MQILSQVKNVERKYLGSNFLWENTIEFLMVFYDFYSKGVCFLYIKATIDGFPYDNKTIKNHIWMKIVVASGSCWSRAGVVATQGLDLLVCNMLDRQGFLCVMP